MEHWHRVLPALEGCLPRGPWDWATMNVNDNHFHPVVEPFIGETLALADCGFRDKEGVPENMKICKKATWNERMGVETIFSMLTIVCDLKRIRHRLSPCIRMRLAYVVAPFNILQDLAESFAVCHIPRLGVKYALQRRRK
jgi:hypothetical protein